MAPEIEDRFWFEILDEIREVKSSFRFGTLEALTSVLRDEEWDRLLILMQNADEFS